MMNIASANPALEELNSLLITSRTKALNSTKQEVDDLQKNYAFVFIYKASCPHCHKFAPILEDFANHFSIKVQAYSIDGGALPPFQGEKLSPELFQTFFLSSGLRPIVPALFLLNNDTNQAYPVLFGEAEPYQLASRVSELLKHIKEQFNDEA